MRRDAGNASIGRVLLEHLPDDLFGHCVALYLVASIHRAEYVAVRRAGCASPGVDRDFYPGRRRNSAHAAMLANEVNNTPTAIPLLDVGERQRRHFRSPQPAAEENSKDGTIAQPLHGRDIRRAEERLSLSQREPVTDADANGFRALHASDPG